MNYESSMKKTLFILFVLYVTTGKAATVDTISIYSNSMHKEFKCVVIKPDTYKKKKLSFPVVYLLHGYDGWYSNWIIRDPQLMNYADEYQLMIVCPEGHKSSWYLDSPVDTTMRYETYVGVEVPAYIDSHYRTVNDRKGRAITGLSMGGHGALLIAFRHSDKFGACGSMSGVVDLAATKNKYELTKRIGDTITHAEDWKNFSVFNMIDHYPKDTLAITFDCGLSDPFIRINQQLHQKMKDLNIPHDYTERPGKHEWPYWRNSIGYHLLFFRNYFNKNR